MFTPILILVLLIWNIALSLVLYVVICKLHCIEKIDIPELTTLHTLTRERLNIHSRTLDAFLAILKRSSDNQEH